MSGAKLNFEPTILGRLGMAHLLRHLKSKSSWVPPRRAASMPLSQAARLDGHPNNRLNTWRPQLTRVAAAALLAVWELSGQNCCSEVIQMVVLARVKSAGRSPTSESQMLMKYIIKAISSLSKSLNRVDQLGVWWTYYWAMPVHGPRKIVSLN